MSVPKARYKATRPAPPEAPPSRARRWVKRLIVLGLILGYMALLWYVAFPYIDQHFVNQPAV